VEDGNNETALKKISQSQHLAVHYRVNVMYIHIFQKIIGIIANLAVSICAFTGYLEQARHLSATEP